MLYAFKMGLLAFDATRLCAADVGFPIDVLLYQRNSFELVEQRYHADELRSISNWWQERMHRSVRTCRPSGSKRRSLGSPVRKWRPENFGSALHHLPLRRAGLPGAAHAAVPSARRCLAAVGDVFVEDRAVPRRHHGVAGSGRQCRRTGLVCRGGRGTAHSQRLQSRDAAGESLRLHPPVLGLVLSAAELWRASALRPIGLHAVQRARRSPPVRDCIGGSQRRPHARLPKRPDEGAPLAPKATLRDASGS